MINIKDIQGNIILSVSITESAQKVEELMSNDYIQLSWNSDSSNSLPLGSYIEHEGERYSLIEPYTPSQKNEVEFVYTPQFKSRVMAWGKKPFFFYSGESREPDWALTSNPADFMRCVCDAILEETGESWSYSIDASLPASASLSFTSVDILSGLNQIAGAFETEWFADKSTNTIYLGLLSHGEEVTLEVGKNINVPSVQGSKEGYYTRFYAFGSTRNITQDYEGSNINNLVNKRLTLDPTRYPNGYKDIREGLSEGEIFPKVLIFDDVYPSANLSISGVRNRLMYRLDTNGDKIQIGTDEDGTPIYDQYAIWYFRIEGFNFDLSNIIEGYNLSVSFQSGALQLREFELKYYEQDTTITTSDGLKFEAKAGDYEILFIEEGSYIIPSMTGLVPSDGDSVILFNIKMPSEYTQSAYTQLEEELDKGIARMSSDLNNYTFKSNPIAFNDNNPNLSIGRSVRFVNGNYTYNTRVIKLTTHLDFPIEQEITIGNQKVKGNTQQLKEEVASANKDLNLLAVFNDMTQSIQQSYNRTQQMMLEGFAAIKNIWQLRETESGEKYAWSAFNVVTQQGITMYANNTTLDLPSIYAGLPVDNTSIYWEDVTDEEGNVIDRVLKAKIGSGEGGSATLLGDLENVGAWANATATEDRIMVQKKDSTAWTSLLLSEIKGTADFSNVKESGEGNAFTSFTLSEDKKTLTFVKGETFAKSSDLALKWTKDDTKILNWDTAFSWGDHSKQGYTTKTYADENFVTIKTEQTITGKKNFTTGGLFVNGSQIVYDSTNGYWKLDGDLLVTGAITMFASEGKYTPSTIMDAITTDNVNLKVVNGVLTFVGETGGGVADSVDWENIDGKPSWIGSVKPSYTFSEIGSKPTTISGYGITDAKISNGVITLGANTITPLTTHQTIYNLTFQAGAFSAKTFDPNGAAQTVNIPTKTSHITNDSNFITPSYVDGKFVTIAGSEDVTGVHNFTNGLKVGGIKMSKSQSGVVFLEGNLVVSGAVTMFGTNSVTASTVMDGVVVDGTTIMNDGKKLYLNPNLDLGGGASSWGELEGKPPYLGTTGLNYTLSIKNSAGTEQVSYNGSSTKSLTLTKSMIGLGNVENTALSTWTGSTKITTLGTVTSGTWNGSKITNAYLANSAVTISGKSVSLGGSLSQADLRTALGLGSNAYTSTAYLPLSNTSEVTVTNSNAGVVNFKSTNSSEVGIRLYFGSTNMGGLWANNNNGIYLYSHSTGDRLGLGSSQPYFYDSSALDGEGATYNLLHRGWISTSIFGNNYLDIMVQYTINTTSLSTSNYYPIVFAATPKMMRVSMYSQTGSATSAYNCNSLDFSFRGQGWTDVPQGLTVHHYSNYTASEKTIGCIGMGQEGGMKVVWVRGGLFYYISSNVTPVLCSSNYSNGNEIFTVGTNQYGGTNTKVTILWTPQSTSDRGTMYHRGGIALGGGLSTAGNLSITGTSTFTGLATFNGNLTAPASTVQNSLSGSYQFRNIYGEHLSSAGWYRFATSSTANNAGGTYIFFIRRSYYNSNNEAYIISCTVDFNNVHWCILNGHANTRLITQVRCTYTNNGTMYFDLYYSGTVLNDVYVNAIGDCTLQKPTSTTSTLTTTSTFSLTDGIKLGTTSAYPITVFRNATSGGAYIMYGANGQLTKSWAAGSDTSHNFAWYYKDTSAGTDVRKMYLDSSGNLLVTGGITMYSDERKKTIIRDVELSLKQVAEAPLVEHYYNSDEKKTAHVGSIAQYWAGLNDWFCKKDSDGYYTMEIQNAALASVISVARELSRFENDTDRRIRLLEEENKKLKEEIEQLKTA